MVKSAAIPSRKRKLVFCGCSQCGRFFCLAPIKEGFDIDFFLYIYYNYLNLAFVRLRIHALTG